MENVVEQVRVLTDMLLAEGWVRVNPSEIATPDLRIWLGTTYVTGEYTVHASHRVRGYGVPKGNIRVRVTPALVDHHPRMGEYLAQDLLNARKTMETEGFDEMSWPPPIWAELSVQGVVDLR